MSSLPGAIGILADVQGPKLRVGRFSAGRAHLQTGRPFRLDLNATPGDSNRVNLPHPEIIEAAREFHIRREHLSRSRGDAPKRRSTPGYFLSRFQRDIQPTIFVSLVRLT